VIQSFISPINCSLAPQNGWCRFNTSVSTLNHCQAHCLKKVALENSELYNNTLLHSLGRAVLENIQFSIRFCTYPLYGCANTASFELCIHLYYPPTCATTYETMFCSRCELCFKDMHPVCSTGLCTCIVICIGCIPYICHTLSPHVSVWNVVQCLPTILHRLSMSVGSVPTLWP